MRPSRRHFLFPPTFLGSISCHFIRPSIIRELELIRESRPTRRHEIESSLGHLSRPKRTLKNCSKPVLRVGLRPFCVFRAKEKNGSEKVAPLDARRS